MLETIYPPNATKAERLATQNKVLAEEKAEQERMKALYQSMPRKELTAKQKEALEDNQLYQAMMKPNNS